MKFNHILFSLFIISLFLCAQPAHTEEAESSVTPSWQETAREAGLSEKDISSLEKNRILITNDTYKQIFSAYIGSKKPSFITSDSFLNAYHVAYEESILQLENTMAGRLPFILKMILKSINDTDYNITGNPMLLSSAKKRATLVIGIALRLTDDSFRLKDDELNSIIEEEIKRIFKAKDILMPDWLGKPDPTFIAIDYSRFRPRGFYTQSERLKRYFRAVSWLQAIPFRVSKDEELLAILMLGKSISSGRIEESSLLRKRLSSFLNAYNTFIGTGDNWDLMDAADRTRNDFRMDLTDDNLQKWRDWLMAEALSNGAGSKINDRIRSAHYDPEKKPEPEFRIISAYRVPDAILFQQTTDPDKFKRPYPEGLEVLTVLGSDFAGRNLNGQKKKILKTIEPYKACFTGESLYIKYLDVLKTLIDEPDSEAPDFMKTTAWKIKSSNTALSGWAQLRHTWTLQAKLNNHSLSAPAGPKGFVEPEPEFFSKMSELLSDTQISLKHAGAFDPDPDSIIRSIEGMKKTLEGVENSEELKKNISRLGSKAVVPYWLMARNKTEAKYDTPAYYNEQRQWLDALLADLKKGRIDKYPWMNDLFREKEWELLNDWKLLVLKEMWQLLEFTIQRLEAISYKQLKHINLNEDENEFLGMYGVIIAGIMQYDPPASLRPRDDAMRVADVYANLSDGGYLHAGIARPRKLYVLYPWEGQTILCIGAVLPYYEFVNSSRLNDELWKKMLDSDKRPSIPEWAAPIVTEGHLGKPEYEKHP